MSRWFRVYDDMVDDPKVQRLPDASFKVLVNLWCLASQGGGKLPSIEDMAFKLRMKPEKVAALISSLTNAGLIDELDDELAPHNWDKRQFKSDVSNERVKRHRERQCNVTDTVTVTPPDTEQIQSTEQIQKKDIRAVATATRTDETFEEFWKVYPKRDGRNPKAPARKKFLAALKSGTDAQRIIAGAQRYRVECQSKQQIGTPYVAMTVTWLNQQSWDDYAPVERVNTGPPRTDLPSDEELRRKYGAANGRRDGISAENLPDAGQNGAAGSDNTGKLLGSGVGDDPGELPGQCASGAVRNAGIRSLGTVFRHSSALAALRDVDGGSGPEPGFDAAGAVARVVRS